MVTGRLSGSTWALAGPVFHRNAAIMKTIDARRSHMIDYSLNIEYSIIDT
ncbi:hypothetical protein SBA4_940008 [Candidatus Sulfopaludibacter sp. SbA4]|nr:hypothetical protein SBA4_940008 [Candidatus Sulfopaludibacter sp. SbA4]